MAVEKMHLSMPLPAGLEGFPFTTFQAELEAFTVKLRAEAKKAKAKPEVKEAKAKEEKAKPEVKAKVKKAKAKEAKPEVEAKAKEAKAKEAKAKEAKPEVEAKSKEVKAKPQTDQVDYSDGDVSDGYHSQDDNIGSDGRVMSRYERHVQANNARCPFLVGA
ncbi:hypothetical protein VPH35_132667 [Triticum aestivum]|uniref:Uncharacterized protein n=1 Tax=Triticum aestivum TaxID=4565 RepID=A0A3B6U757_WHEAT